ncbi:uncharacterized protein LTR77_006622 [Saxophila tyrrhenica]|uniref:Uncharacterized protein n=1 Tax=Saxophila tyrrhenica TaxID=1690608 RepID=A0AAV9P621_9PEZI|nr:hypothetical protein LTR77_006622 [Saxophila tyrrhenica]
MLELDHENGPNPKCFYTSSMLPSFVDHKQIPSKKKPFATIGGRPFVHTVDLLLPQENEDALLQTLGDAHGSFTYAKVYMKPSEVVTGDFFNHYIKTGNILMISEGRPGIDHTFSLVEGVLRLEVDKATYERLGLAGEPIPCAGRKHVKIRYAIELNLRLPEMVRGHKGFDRIHWAFNNVLDRSVTWLFYDLKGSNDGAGPMSIHQPSMKTVQPKTETLHQVTVPSFPQTIQPDDHDIAAELLEWLTMVAMDSPRVRSEDHLDSYLSRYQVPDISENGVSGGSNQDLVRLRWHGLVPSWKAQEIYLAALKASGDGWFAMHAYAFDGSAYTVLQDKQHTSTWEYMG